jgi:1,4-dihydroxy-2-naphthoate octaprenyltransferase
MNVLIILGHPRKESLCGALAKAYEEGALQANAQVKTLILADLDFDPHVRMELSQDQPFEKDLSHVQETVAWADNLVFVYPTWWGMMPALLKGFLDRVLTPGFAFAFREDGSGDWERLLTGKSAQLITTVDTPPWVYRWIYGQPGNNAMRLATLGFCGIKPTHTLVLGPVKDSSLIQRKEWLETARQTGFKLRKGTLARGERWRDKALAWVKAARLQFYPMTWVAYTIGALGAASPNTSIFTDSTYWLGYLFLFFLEVATVLANDYFDFESDRQNKNSSPFTGGSRMLVESHLSFKEVRIGIVAALALAGVVAGLLIQNIPAPLAGGVTMLVALILAMGYTVPPLKLSYRGLGELNVGITHSLIVVLCGYVFQGGGLGDAFPWLISVPLFLSVLPAIILAGIPDYEADKAAAKRTLPVVLGQRRAIMLTMGLTLLAAISALVWQQLHLAQGAFSGAAYFILPHAALLVVLLYSYLEESRTSGRINGLLVAALSYIIWFGAIPFFQLTA